MLFKLFFTFECIAPNYSCYVKGAITVVVGVNMDVDYEISRRSCDDTCASYANP